MRFWPFYNPRANDAIFHLGIKLMSAINDLKAATDRLTASTNAATALLATLHGQSNDPAITEATQAVNAASDALDAAVVANAPVG